MGRELSVAWYVESGGAFWTEPAPGGLGARADERHRPTGLQELWVMDGGEVLARATALMMACAPLRMGRTGRPVNASG